MNIKYLVQIARITMFANRYCPMSNPIQISRKPQHLPLPRTFNVETVENSGQLSEHRQQRDLDIRQANPLRFLLDIYHSMEYNIDNLDSIC